MQVTLLVCLILVSLSAVLPQTQEEGMLDILTDVGKSIMINSIKSHVNCPDTCLEPLYYCYRGFIAQCRYGPLSWFLMIGLPLIIIGIAIGVWYYRRKRR